MTSLYFFVYIFISLELVFGEYGIANNNRDPICVARVQDITANQEDQNISELPKGESEKIPKPFSMPKALAIGGSILTIPVLGYTVYCRKNQKKQQTTFDQSKTTEDILDESKTTEDIIVKSEITEEIPQIFSWKGLSIHELPIIQQQRKYLAFGYFDGLEPTQDEPMVWESNVGTSQIIFGYPRKPTGNLKVEDLNSSIQIVWPDNIYSPPICKFYCYPFLSARRFGLPPYYSRKGQSEEEAHYIEHVFYFEENDKYLKEFKEVYGQRFDNVESKNIDDMIDDLILDHDEVTIGKIKTNLPVGFVIRVKTDSWTGRDKLSMIICAHDYDQKTGETIVSLAYREDSDPENIRIPTHMFCELPERMLKNALRTFAHIILNTLPEKKDIILMNPHE